MIDLATFEAILVPRRHIVCWGVTNNGNGSSVDILMQESTCYIRKSYIWHGSVKSLQLALQVACMRDPKLLGLYLSKLTRFINGARTCRVSTLAGSILLIKQLTIH
jgi:hypothetical protein